jgi:hypothetical protein
MEKLAGLSTKGVVPNRIPINGIIITNVEIEKRAASRLKIIFRSPSSQYGFTYGKRDKNFFIN